MTRATVFICHIAMRPSLVAVALAFVAAVTVVYSAPAAAQVPLHLIVPAYAYPCEPGVPCTYDCDGQTCEDEGFAFWSGAALAARRGVPTLAIVNVADGPGDSVDT